MNETRTHKKGGGVAIVFNDFLQCKQLSFGNFALFEYVALLLKSSSRIMFINIYSPPKYCANFFDDFTDLLSTICMDFYPRTKGPTQPWSVLDNFGLTRHVAEPTHNKGHTLDLIISQGLNISKVVVTDVSLADHAWEHSLGTHKCSKEDHLKTVYHWKQLWKI